MAQLVKHLPRSDKGVNLIPSTRVKRLGSAVHACSASARKWGTGASLEPVDKSPAESASSRFSERRSKNIGIRGWRRAQQL